MLRLQLAEEVNVWLDSFSNVLTRWEQTLLRAEQAYLNGQVSEIVSQTTLAESIQQEIVQHKVEREEILSRARGYGFTAHHLKAFAMQLGSECPPTWLPKITELELQLNRVQQISTSLWMSALHSQSTVTEMLLILATGRNDSATYHPNETHSLEGGFLVNEAA
ncbi:hypothetical protein SH449x_005478 [Pirellulaceae bacterium SH449]